MKTLQCPKCGNVFTVDEADYAAIASQVRTAEFNTEVEQRLHAMEAQHKAEQELAATKTAKEFSEKLGKKDAVLAEKDRIIAELNSAIKSGEAKLQIAVMEEQKKLQQTLQDKDKEILQLQAEAQIAEAKAKNEADEIVKRYEVELKAKQEQIDYYKDMKARMSTKMIGESLEAHCSTLFNQLLRPMMPSAYFEKDNEVREGTKGDFIFRDHVDGIEYVSIMFEMKNESDSTSTKHRNEDFFKKLDEDRKKKQCEFAVLVSLLEPDSELYNGGIVDVSYRYEKMYVIRPQFFIPLITLLVQTSKKSLEYKRQLILAQSREVDVTNFENNLLEFKNKFKNHYDLAAQRFSEAIKQIDASIKQMQKVKESLQKSENKLRLANQDAEELTIRKLTYKNPTMKQKFDEARRLNNAYGDKD